MTIVPYSRDLLDGILEAYNLQFADEPYAGGLTRELFLDLIEPKTYFNPNGFLVAVDGDRVIGWIHACVAPGTEVWHNPSHRTGRIVMLVFPPARLTVGAALVVQTVEWLNAEIGGVLEAMHPVNGYPFYRGLWMGGEPVAPATIPHVHLVLETNGFRPAFQSILMTASLDQSTRSAAMVALELVNRPAEMAHEPMAESWTGFEPQQTEAKIGTRTIGIIRWVVLPEATAKLGGPLLNIWGLEVSANFQRKGVAGALIASILRTERCRAVRTASVATQLDNVAAHATYSRFGFNPNRLLIGRTRPASLNAP